MDVNPMHPRWLNTFTRSAGLGLIALAVFHFVGNQGEIVFQPSEPIFEVSTRYLFWGLAGLELIVALGCLFSKSLLTPNLLLAWLTTNIGLYRLGLLYFGVRTTSAYYETMAHRFGLSNAAMNFACSVALIGLWCGSISVVALLWKPKAITNKPGHCEPEAGKA